MAILTPLSPSHCTVSASARRPGNDLLSPGAPAGSGSTTRRSFLRADFVSEQPPNRIRAVAFRDVQLTREQPDPPAEKGPNRAPRVSQAGATYSAASRSRRTGRDRRCQPLEQRPVAPTRLLRHGNKRVARCRQPECRLGVRKGNDQNPSFDCGEEAAAQIRIEARHGLGGRLRTLGRTPDFTELSNDHWRVSCVLRPISAPPAVGQHERGH